MKRNHNESMFKNTSNLYIRKFSLGIAAVSKHCHACVWMDYGYFE